MSPYVVAAITVLVLMTTMWLISLAARDASLVDIAWGFGYVLVAWSTALVAGSWGAVTVVMTVIVTVWGLRLALYLAWRNLGHGEDPRYADMRRRHGPAFWYRSIWMVFGLQGALMWVVSLPIQATADSTAAIGVVTIVGVVVWLFGVAFETVGDLQLAQFKADPANRGRVLDSGLWRYTRHPNYFGDAVAWWGIYLVAASAGGWWTIIGPIVMTFLLLRVSGVAHLERTLEHSKPGYRDYIARTSAFVPRPPRSDASTS